MSKSIVDAKIFHWNELFTTRKDKSSGKKKRNLLTKLEFTADGNIINSLLGGEDEVQYFLEHAFQRHPIVRSGNCVKEVREKLFYDLDVLSLLKETSSDAIHVWLNQLQSETLESITLQDPEQAYKLYQAGHSLYCRAPKEVEDLLVARLSNELHYGLKNINSNDRYRRGEIEMFFSRKGHLTKFHTDFQENFTIQLKGRKKWTFKTSTAFAPIRGCTLHFNDTNKHSSLIEQQLKILKVGDIHFNGSQVLSKESSTKTGKSNEGKETNPPKKKQKTGKMEKSINEVDEEVEERSDYTEVILEEGDIMYHPAGIWHQVECIEDSISMNISLTSVSFADIFCNHLQQMLLESPLFRSSVFRPEHDVKNYPKATDIMNSIISVTPKLLQGIKGEDILPYPTLHLLTEKPNGGTDEISVTNQSRKVLGKRKSSDNDDEEEDDEEEVIDEDSVDEEVEYSEGSDNEEIEIIEEEETDPQLKDIINVHDVSIEDFMSENPSFSSNTKLSSLSFRLNPFAVLLSDKDLWNTSGAVLKGSSEDVSPSENKYYIHSGYGNETLESVNRKIIVLSSSTDEEDEEEQLILDQLQLAMYKIQNVYYTFRIARQEGLSDVEKLTKLEGIHRSIPTISLQFFSDLFMKYPKRKEMIEEKISKLLIGLFYAGFFSSCAK